MSFLDDSKYDIEYDCQFFRALTKIIENDFYFLYVRMEKSTLELGDELISKVAKL